MRLGVTWLRRQGGLSLVELMVAMAVSLVLLGGIYQIFFSSATSYSVNENYSRLQENARFAMGFLERDVRQAGYRGCRNDPAAFVNLLQDADQFDYNFALPLEGFDAAAAKWDRTLPKVVTAPRRGSDILALRNQLEGTLSYLRTDMASRQAPLPIPPGSQDQPYKSTGGDLVMVSDCQGATVFQISSYIHGQGEVLHQGSAGSPGNRSDDLNRLYRRNAELGRVATVLYYVRNSAERVPCLYRKVGAAGAEALVEGVESMQILYGIDDDGDRAADRYLPASAALPWELVVSLRIGLLLRSLTEDPRGEVDNRVYDVNGQSVGPANDRHFRQVFSSTIGLRNRLL
jgi:type IV pilus assembly protein PilW